ncbi:MAG: penicillin-binding protein 2 [Fimbriimonadaceae bacterium]|nr:penicillin-binding protein 2 [Fimbriimonadaceae bacterium]
MIVSSRNANQSGTSPRQGKPLGPGQARHSGQAGAWVPAILAAGFVVAWGSQAIVHTARSEAIKAEAKRAKRYAKTIVYRAARGRILDRHGMPLAAESSLRSLQVDAKKSPRSPGFALATGLATGVSATEILPVLATGTKADWDVQLSAQQQLDFARFVARWRPDSTSSKVTGTRQYPLNQEAAIVVGGWRDQMGMRDGRRQPIRLAAGIERSFDEILRGEDGRIEAFTDRNGNVLPGRIIPGSAKDKVAGQDVMLTIDAVLQRQVYAALRAQMETSRALSGTAIVLDPTNGDILALASYPTFSSQPVSTQPENFNSIPAVQWAYEPGSTFKILSLAKAIDMGRTTVHDTFTCTGVRRLSGKDIHCAHLARHGTINGTEGIAKSCNLMAIRWGEQVGHREFVRFMRDAGLFDPTGIGLEPETPGRFVEGESNKALQLATFGFGQSLRATPVALASAFGSIGNDGVRVPPRLVRVVGKHAEPIREGRAILGESAADEVLRAMEAVFENGTANSLRIPGYRLAGKTGTAEKIGTIDPVTRRPVKGHVANFVGFVPAREPRAVVLVMIDQPKGKYFGGEVAGPVFRNIALSLIDRFKIPADQPVARTRRPRRDRA